MSVELRTQRQKELAKKWMDSGRRGIIYAAPRFGKIFTTINILEQLKPKRVIISYPDNKIKQSWMDDFEKRGWDYENVTFTTHLSLKKHVEEKYDFIVIDEIHLLSDAQKESVSEILDNHGVRTAVLGLTGTLTSSTENEIFDATGLRVVARYPIEQAIKEGVVVDYSITVYTVPLDNAKILDFKGKKRTEKKHFDSISWVIDKMERDGRNTMFLRLARMRVIQKSIAKMEFTKKLLEKHKDERILVFCGITDIADKLGCPSYHSKKSEKQMFTDFVEGKGNHMAVVKIGNTGVTYKPLNKVIINYFDSNGENMAQKIMRCMAMEYDNLNKKADIIIVSSDETVEVRWLHKALEFFDKSKVKFVSSTIKQ